MILPHKLATTTDLLTSRAGLLLPIQLMESIQLAACIDKHLPQPKSNRGFSASTYVQTFMLMQQNGHFHLDDVRLLNDDKALLSVLSLTQFPCATALGNWLRRLSKQPEIKKTLQAVNKHLLSIALHKCKEVTLDIDASEIISSKADAKWTYNNHQGYMPMVGHIAQTDQVVACDFREGNCSPASQNLEFIKHCEAGLPKGVRVKALRIDAAGYQTKIIQYCDTHKIEYAIRAKMSPTIKALITQLKDDQWEPLLDEHGEPTHQQSYRTTHCIGDYEHAFTLVIQRQAKRGQMCFDLEGNQCDELADKSTIYRAIATNQDNKTDNEVVNWYNQRGEASENRIKELKSDFGGGTLPCSDFNANALYFSISTLSYNLFALMRQFLPEELSSKRAITLRWRVYAIAAKVVKTGRQLIIKLREDHRVLLLKLLDLMRRVKPPPI